MENCFIEDNFEYLDKKKHMGDSGKFSSNFV